MGSELRPTNWSYRRIVLLLSLAVAGYVLAVIAKIAALSELYKSAPHPPPLTPAGALTILQEQPEFLEQGDSPEILSCSSGGDPSIDSSRAGCWLTFNAKNGQQVKGAGLSFVYISGRWQFEQLSWRTPPTNSFSIRKGGHLQIGHTPDPVGTMWKRQEDGSYVTEYPTR